MLDCTCVEGSNSVDDAAHAGDLAPEAVVEGSGCSQDDSACSSVVEWVGVDIYHRENQTTLKIDCAQRN